MRFNVTLILTLVVILLAMLWLFKGSRSLGQSGGGLELNFSDLTDDISKGNPISWSARQNLPGPHSGTEFAETPAFTFWGSGIPLTHETRVGKPDPVIRPQDRIHTLSSANLRCSPECCPSPYSCDHGCVCYRRHRQGGPLVGPTLRKNFTGNNEWP